MSEGASTLYRSRRVGAGPRPSYSISGPRRLYVEGSRRTLQHEQDAELGYDSDDSSLSSNASKTSDKESTSRSSGCGGVTGAREWRGRARRRPAPYPFQVKYTPDDLLNGSKWDSLSQEIWDKFVTSQQSEETFKNKMTVWRQLYSAIKVMFPRYGLYVVGSTMSGFGLEASDMDVCLHVRPAHWLDPRSHALVHLGFALQYIRNVHRDAELIQAKVPILKYSDAATGVQVDLNCNNVVGIRNTSLLYLYSCVDWRVRPLVVVCKLWARAHQINDARRRTLSSYALTLMVIHYLQCGASPPVVPCVGAREVAGIEAGRFRSRNRLTVAELFLQLLHYYADFPYDKMAVSVRAGRPLPVAECRAARALKNDPHQWKLLCVEEPFDLTNTARSVYDPETFERIVHTFRQSYVRLSGSLRLSDAWPPAP